MSLNLYEMQPGFGTHWYREDNGKDERPLRPGDTILCEEFRLRGALHKFKIVKPGESERPRAGLQLLPKGKGWFDVINLATNSPINTVALRKQDAINLISGWSESESPDAQTLEPHRTEKTPAEA